MKVGFIGVGTMGAGMASNMQKGGNELVVQRPHPAGGLPAFECRCHLGRHAKGCGGRLAI